MELCTIETSLTEVETWFPPSVGQDGVLLEQAAAVETAPPFDESDPSGEDDLEIEDEALVAAASECQTALSNRPREKSAWVTAFTLAIFIHAAGAAICMVLAVVVLAPVLSFTQGSGSSESGLLSEKSNQTESQESGVPGLMVAVPEIQKTVTAEPRTADENQNDPEFSPEQVRPITVLASDAQLPDAPAIGVATDTVGPMPVRHHATPKDAPASATASAATGNMGTHATASALSGNAVAARHSFVAPRGAGHPGIGAEGSGFDSLGLPLPEYPAESKRRHEEGLVELDVQVKPDGSVAAARIVKDSGYPRLNNAALASIRAARFTPATVDGVPVPARVLVPYRFTLQ